MSSQYYQFPIPKIQYSISNTFQISILPISKYFSHWKLDIGNWYILELVIGVDILGIDYVLDF